MKSTILLSAVLISCIVNAANHLPARIVMAPYSIQSVKPDPVFNAFRAHRQGKGITTMWSSCDGSLNVTCFTVIRTYEDPTDPYSEWAVVGAANRNSGRNYRLTDETVTAGFVSYRIVASLANGGFAYSDVETVHIVQQ